MPGAEVQLLFENKNKGISRIADNFVVGVHVTAGNVHDSVAFDPLYDELCETYPEHKVIVADSAYKTPWICKRIFESGRVLSSAYTRPKIKSGNLPWYEYVYDEFYDQVICPAYKTLNYATTNREGYREYRSKSYICENCADRERCTQYRGLTQVTNWVKLKFAAMNLKKLALWKWKRHGGKPSPSFSVILYQLFPVFCSMNNANPTFA